MKNVLLLVHDDDGQEGRLQVALDLVRAIDGHLCCLNIELSPMVLAYPYNGMVTAELVTVEHDQAQAIRDRLIERLGREDVAWDWQEATELPFRSIKAASGLADIVVLSSGLETYDPMELRHLAGQAADKTNCPILAVPNNCMQLDVSGTVLIAWDGSSEADNALRKAVPLLQRAKNVILLDLDEPDGSFAPVTAASYLSRHDIHAEVETAQRKDGEAVFEAILNRAHEAGAAYIVMGAFGHAPAIEAIVGGVTRSMLAHSDVPLLLAH